MTATEPKQSEPFRILSLDGGGAKGFYSLGVLREIEALAGKPLHEAFQLVFGSSTGAIIAALIANGLSVDAIHTLYKEHVPRIMQRKTPPEKSKALADLATEVYGDAMFDTVKTGVGILTTKWSIERPMIFKGNVAQAHGRLEAFVPGFGVTIADAVQASCSAYPFFDRKVVTTAAGDDIELVDGGYCASNPTLYAIADATRALGQAPENLRVVSVGAGNYPDSKASFSSQLPWSKHLLSVLPLQKTLDVDTQSMDQLRTIQFKHVPTVRISDTFEKPDMATKLFEHNLTTLNMLRQRGVESFANREAEIKSLMTS